MATSRTYWMRILSVVLVVILVLEAVEARVSNQPLYHITACGPFQLLKEEFISFLD